MKENLAQIHKNCEMSIRWKMFTGKSFPTPGLFCRCHDAFLDWLPENIAFDLIDNHGVIEEIYTERKKKNAKPSLSKAKDNSNYLKNRQKKKKKTKLVEQKYLETFGRLMPR